MPPFVRHTHSGRRALGLTLAVATASLYATIPIGLKMLVQWIPIPTLTWFRFIFAYVLLVPIVVRRHGVRGLFAARSVPILSLICVAGLIGNNLAYQAGVRSITPDTAQVVMQLGPIVVLIGGLGLFRERFGAIQWVGVTVSVAGLLLFFNMRYFDLLLEMDTYAGGVLFVVAAALCYAVFALSQKQLLVTLPSEQILITVYSAGSVVMVPFVDFGALGALDPARALVLVIVSCMTLLAYWLYTLTLKHIEVSRSSVAIAASPIITIIIVSILASTRPNDFASEHLNWLSIVGVFLLVAGMATHAIRRRVPPRL